MKTSLDRFGRIVIPQKVREGLGLKPGAVLRVEEEGSAIVLRPEMETPGLVHEKGVLVISAHAPAAALREAVQNHREGRLATLSGRKSP